MYSEIVLLLIQIMAPATIIAAAFLWWLHAQDRKRDTRLPLPRLRLSLVFATTATFTAIGSSYLAVATTLFRSGHPLPADWASVTVTVILLLELPPLVKASYMLWLSGHETGKED